MVLQQVSGGKNPPPRSGVKKAELIELVEPQNEAGSEVEGFYFLKKTVHVLLDEFGKVESLNKYQF